MRVYVSIASPRRVASSSRRWAAISGATCLAMLIVGGSLQLGNITIPPVATAPRQLAVGLVGAVLIAASFLVVESAGAAPTKAAGILADPDFWFKVFNAMPPAFIKEYPADAHVTDNQPFRTLQGDKPREPMDTTELHTLINSDHRQGDSIAAATGASVLLEFSDHFPTRYPQLILTFKTRIEHDERTFVVGWCVPIESSDAVANREILEVKKRGEQVLFQVPASDLRGDNPFLINVGKAVRRPDLYRHGVSRLRRRP